MRDLKKYEMARELRARGLTMAEVAQQLGVSRGRVQQMLAFLERDARGLAGPPLPPDPLELLSTRARNCLLSIGLSDPKAIKAQLELGGLDKVANLGPLTLAEIQAWLKSLPSNAKLSGPNGPQEMQR